MTLKKPPQNLKSTRNKRKSSRAQIYFFSHFQDKKKKHTHIYVELLLSY
jgi:hypothetical protein